MIGQDAEYTVLGASGFATVDDVLEDMRERGRTRASLQLPGTISRAQMERFRRLRDKQFFLVRNRGGDTGERYACKRHLRSKTLPPGMSLKGVFHEYFTCMCINMPWRGLDKALYGYATMRSDGKLTSSITAWASDMALAHPQSFGKLRPDKPGEDMIAIALGVLEPISESKARALESDINSRRPEILFVL